MMVLG